MAQAVFDGQIANQSHAVILRHQAGPQL